MPRGLLLILLSLALFLAPFCTQASDDRQLDDKAARTSAAIRSGRYDDAEDIIRDVIHESRIENWSYSPFDGFIAKVTLTSDTSWTPYFDAWVSAHDNSPLPLLFRANYNYRMALGPDGEIGGTLSKQKLMQNVAHMAVAWKDVLKIMRFPASPDKTPYAAYLFVHISRYAVPAPDRERIFRAAADTYPGYYSLYRDRLSQLTPSMGGSTFKMLYFTYDSTASLPAASPMRMLGLDLYLDLVRNVTTDCKGFDKTSTLLCEKRQGEILHDATLIAKVKEALALYQTVGHYRFNQELTDRLWCSCFASSPYAETMFGVIEEGLGTDNYAVNEGFGYLYYNEKSYARALDYYRKALKEIKVFDFPAKDQENATLAGLYYNISLASGELGDNKGALESVNSAIALDDHNADYYRDRCGLDEKLGNQKDSISDCLKADTLKPLSSGQLPARHSEIRP